MTFLPGRMSFYAFEYSSGKQIITYLYLLGEKLSLIALNCACTATASNYKIYYITVSLDNHTTIHIGF